jgi:hypothetical protein
MPGKKEMGTNGWALKFLQLATSRQFARNSTVRRDWSRDQQIPELRRQN